MKIQRRARRGATSIEYGLIAGVISVSIVLGATQLGQSLESVFSFFAGEIDKTTEGL